MTCRRDGSRGSMSRPLKWDATSRPLQGPWFSDLIETRSASLTDGLKNLIDDLQKGRITRVDESAFEVGRNLATTPGSVVFRSDRNPICEPYRRIEESD